MADSSSRRRWLRIGAFGRQTGLTPRALRHYERLGLLRPAHVDPATGYRLYSPAQIAEGLLLRRLRELEIPLPCVRALLQAADERERAELLASHADGLRERARALWDTARRAELALEELREATRPAFRDVPAHSVLVREIACRGDDAIAAVGRAAGELVRALRRAGARPAGPLSAVYERPEACSESTRVRVELPADPFEGVGTGYPLVREPADRVASVLHAGPYAELASTYARLRAWMERRGLAPRGWPRESYLVPPAAERPSAALRTEIQWPVA